MRKLSFAVSLCFATSTAYATTVVPADQWAAGKIARVVGNVTTGSTAVAIENAITGHATVRTGLGATLRVPIAWVATPGGAAVARAASFLVPAVGIGLTAGLVADVLKPAGYEWCTTGWCKKLYPDRAPTTSSVWRDTVNYQSTSNLEATCDSLVKESYASYSSWNVSSNVTYPTGGQEAFCNFKLVAKSNPDLVQQGQTRRYTFVSSTTSCVTINGMQYNSQGAMCVAADQSRTTATREDAENAIKGYYNTRTGEYKWLADAVNKDLAQHPELYYTDADPITKDTPLKTTAAPVSTPQTTTKTVTKTLPDGTVEKSVTKTTETVTSTPTGTTMGDTKIGHTVDTKDVVETTNTTTGSTTREETVVTDTATEETPASESKPEIDLSHPNVGPPELEKPPTGYEIIKPILDLMPSLRNFAVPSHSGTCPKPSVNLFGTTYTMSTHCDLIEPMRSTMQSVAFVVYAIVAVFIILGA